MANDVEKFKKENGGFWLGGCNTSLEPETIPSQPYPQYAWGENVDNTRGQVSTRDGFDQLMTLPGGKPQMLAHFRTSNNHTDYVVMVVSGQVYTSPAPFTQWRNLGVSLDAGVHLCTHVVVERGAKRLTADSEGRKREVICPKRYIIIQDGVNAAVAWDGGFEVERPADIPVGKWMAYVNNRLFVAVGEEIFWSDIADPFSFYDLGFLADGGQFRLRSPVTGLAMSPDGQALLAFETDACWRFLVATGIKKESDWKTTPGFQSKILSGVGCLAGNSFVEHYGDLWWWSNKDLMSFRRALSVNTEDELNQTDLEMTRSREKFGNIDDDIVGISHLNYLLINTPVNEIWAKNNSPASLLNTNTAPAWMGVWTGLRVKEFASFYVAGELFTLALSRDYDDRTRLWKLFNGKQQDNQTRIKCAVEFKAHAFGDVTTMKKIRWFDFMMQRVWGDVAIKAYFRGLRGGWNEILTSTIKAAPLLDTFGNKILQFRRLFSQEIFPESLDCANCGQESDLVDTIDFAFQLQIQFEGEASIDNYRLAAFTELEQLAGKCEVSESLPSVVNQCLPALDYQIGYFVQTTTSEVISFQLDPCSEFSEDVSITVQTQVIPANPPASKAIAQIQGSQCPCAAIRLYTATQTYIANCTSGTGTVVTKTASATSSISQTDANSKAMALAKDEADAELVCTWTSEKTYTATCGTGLTGIPVTKTVTYSSTVSQLDADTQALALATLQADAELVCAAPTDFAVIGGLGGGLGPNLYELGLYRTDGSPSDNWAGSAGTDGVVYTMSRGFSIWVGGDFNSYNTIPSFCLVKLNEAGIIDPFWTNSLVDGLGNRAVTVVSNVATKDNTVAVSGLFSHWRGTPSSNFVVADGTTGAILTTSFVGTNGLVRQAISSGTGWIIIGEFTTVNGVARPYIARLNSDGSLDLSFVPANTTSPVAVYGPNGAVDSICANGAGFLASGRFSSWNETTQKGVVGLTAAGAVNGFFTFGGAQVAGLSKIAFDGVYIFLATTTLLSRLLQTGASDPIFPQVTFTGDINAIVISGINYLVLGSFTVIQSTTTDNVVTTGPGQFAALLTQNGTISQQFNFNPATGRGWFGNTLYCAVV